MIVRKSGGIIAELVEVHRGVECLRGIDAKAVMAGKVLISARAT